ncbi:hypothetical protein ACFQVD_36795 [Streptosporangium amethystogenes subsp. fukuiense]|uniref:Sel1 repeat family protein n=1 Tax=Streptosporangium amethystogenes subsp. fukuiense TaxID=698418 RepID=A0ABW2TC96_9ACTN
MSEAARRLYDELRALERRARAARRAAGAVSSRREAAKALARAPYMVTVHAQRFSDWLPDDPARAHVPMAADSDKVLAIVRLWSVWAGEPPPDRRYWNNLIDAAQPARLPGETTGKGPARGRPISRWDPFDLGVHRAIEHGENPQPPPLAALPRYVRRGHDAELRDLLDPCRGSVMAVLVGGSSTGKTRACYEAVKNIRYLSGWQIVHPADGGELDELLAGNVASRSLLWLNETRLYLEGEHGPSIASRLRRLLTDDRRLVVVLGSMWPKYWQTFTAQPEEGAPDRHAQIRELLKISRVHKVDVPDDFSLATDAERAELDSLSVVDPRLATALRTAGPSMRIIQVLAGGEMLVDRYEHIFGPHGRALITAAMDARRLGHREPLPATLLEQAVSGYLTPAQRAVGGGWFASALADATETVRGIHALEPNRIAPGMGPPDSYGLHDYLDQYARGARGNARLPTEAWDALADHAVGADDRDLLAAAAELRYLFQYAVRLAQPAAEAGNISAMCRLGALLYEAGHREAGERRLRQAVEAGNGWAVGRLVTWLKQAGREDEMEPVVRGAAERGHAQSIAALASRLRDTGRSHEADDWLKRLRQAAEAGDREAMLWWTATLRWSDHPEYENWLLRGAEAGIREAIVSMSDRKMWTRDDPAVESVLRQAADRGDGTALRMLHRLLVGKGREPEVNQMWTGAARGGSAYAMRVLGARLLHAGENDGAERWLCRAARAGDGDAMCVWAGLLARAGDDENVEHWLRRAAEADNDTAVTLGPMWIAGGEHRQDAREALRTVVETGDSRISLLSRVAFGPVTERWLREVAEAGGTSAMKDLTLQLERAGRHTESERWLRHSIEAGVPKSDRRLWFLLQHLGRAQEAQRLQRFGIEVGGRTSDPW